MFVTLKKACERTIFDPNLHRRSPPKQHQNGPQTAPKQPQNGPRPPRAILTPLRTPLDPPLGPQVSPKLAPSWPQVGHKLAPSRPEDTSRHVKMASKKPLAPKTTRRSKSEPKRGPTQAPPKAKHRAPASTPGRFRHFRPLPKKTPSGGPNWPEVRPKSAPSWAQVGFEVASKPPRAQFFRRFSSEVAFLDDV